MASHAGLLHRAAAAMRHSSDRRGAQFTMRADLLQCVWPVWRHHLLAALGHLFGEQRGVGRLLHASHRLLVSAIW